MRKRILTPMAVLSLFLVLLSLVACSGLTRSDKPAVTTWWLKPYSAVVNTHVAEGRTVRLLKLQVTAIPGLDNDRILALTTDAELKPYAGARWADHIPELMDSLIGRSLESSGRFTLSRLQGQHAESSCELELEIREFFSEVLPSGRPGQVSIAVDGVYQCGSTAGQVIALRHLRVLEDNRMKSIVAAFQAASDDLMKALLETI